MSCIPTDNTTPLTCYKPYIKVGNICCLDKNNNNRCDNDESRKSITKQLEESGYNEYVIKYNKAINCNKECNLLIEKYNQKLKVINIYSPEYNTLMEDLNTIKLDLGAKYRECEGFWLETKLFVEDNKEKLGPLLLEIGEEDYYQLISRIQMQISFHQEARIS